MGVFKANCQVGQKSRYISYITTVVRQLIYPLSTLVKESSQRARLEEEMLSAKSDSVVEVALLRAEYERKQEIMQAKLKDIHKKDLEKGKKNVVSGLQLLSV